MEETTLAVGAVTSMTITGTSFYSWADAQQGIFY